MSDKRLIAWVAGGFLAAVLLDAVFSGDYRSAYTLAVLFVAKVCYYVMIIGTVAVAFAVGVYTKKKIPNPWAYIPAAILAFVACEFVFDIIFLKNQLLGPHIRTMLFSSE